MLIILDENLYPLAKFDFFMVYYSKSPEEHSLKFISLVLQRTLHCIIKSPKKRIGQMELMYLLSKSICYGSNSLLKSPSADVGLEQQSIE